MPKSYRSREMSIALRPSRCGTADAVRTHIRVRRAGPTRPPRAARRSKWSRQRAVSASGQVRPSFEMPAIVHCKRRRSYELVHRHIEPMPSERVDRSCPAKTISKASPIWAASMAARKASPNHRRVPAQGSATRMSWQSATPVKPIEALRRPSKNKPRLARTSPCRNRAGNASRVLPLP